MKTIYVAVIFEAMVPEDMDDSQIKDAIEERLEDMEGFRINVQDYHDENESEPFFDKTDVYTGQDMILSLGK